MKGYLTVERMATAYVIIHTFTFSFQVRDDGDL
jgi:hypothetical protein